MQRHHAVYEQKLREEAGRNRKRFLSLKRDERNLVAVAHECHGQHHARREVFMARWLPDSVFEFAVEVLGRERAYEYLRRRYRGDDPRLDALVDGEVRDAG